MFSSLKLNSLKCQSKSVSEKKMNKYNADYDDDDVSEHMYEKLPNFDSKTCRCQSNYISKSPKYLKTSFSKRISKWRMECPGSTNLRISSPDDLELKNNRSGGGDFLTSGGPHDLRKKVTTVNIEREGGNLGITLRGGFQPGADISKPVVITFIKPDGPTARMNMNVGTAASVTTVVRLEGSAEGRKRVVEQLREGTIKCGDRLLAVDGVSLQGRSLSDAQTLLRQPTPSALLTIEYDVNVIDTVERAQGPLLVEMELNSFQELGVELGQNENGIIIESVKAGSLADRCGALHVGDEILAINSTRLNSTVLVLDDLIKFMEFSCPVLRLEILPSYATLNYSGVRSWRSKELLLSQCSTFSGINTLKSHAGRRNQDCNSADLSRDMEKTVEVKPCLTNLSGFHGSNMALTHSETVHTTLYRENGTFGLVCVDSSDGSVLINSVEDGSPAERSQCLYPGDRVLAINNRNITSDNLSAKEVNELLEGISENTPCMKLSLHTEFDVLDSVIPTSGIFTVKLAKRGPSGLGITITASKSSGFKVCEMKKGSIAYRAGSLTPGDKILAINNISLNKCSVEYAAHILHQSSKVVTLRVQRKDNGLESSNIRTVTYTVELQRYGGPLGITIAGSEEPFHPITISGLSSGGLGEQTGVLHIGDEILAINNHNLYGEPLSKAHHLLQNSPDLVILKISRSITPYSRFSSNISPRLSPSADNTTELWGNSHLDLTSSSEYGHKNKCDSRADTTDRDIATKQMSTIVIDNYPNESKSNLMKDVEGETPDLSLLDEISSENLKIKKELDLLSLKLDAECKINLSKAKENREKGDINEEPATAVCHIDGKILTSSEDEARRPGFGNKTQIEPEVNPDNIHSESDKAKELNEVSNEYKRENNETFAINDLENLEITFMSDTKNWFKSHLGNLGSDCGPELISNDFNTSQLYKVTLYKDPIYEDFGFSVSDGLYERGVFINRIRRGGPADMNNILKPYDRILQVNGTFTQDFDCCLTVPLIASAGDSITLLVGRISNEYLTENMLESEKFLGQESHSFPNQAHIEKDVERPQRILV